MADTLAAEETVAISASDEELGHDPHLTNTGISNEKLGMWMFLASECLLFGGLISTYLLYKDKLANFAGLRERRRSATSAPRSTTSPSRRSAPSCC